MISHPCESLFLSEDFSDVTFTVENKSIPGHKMLLAANCPYFKTMLCGATNESKMSAIEINNVSYKSFVELLRCVYLRQVDISKWTPEEVKTLILIADEYQFQEMGCVIAQAVTVDTQITIDVIDDVVGAAKRLQCIQLVEKCAESAQNKSDVILENEEVFDKLPMELIFHLLDKEIWNSADTRLVYLIGNWRRTASTEDKKALLSKIDWKSLPGRYSEPLVRMFLESKAEGLQDKDWTSGLNRFTTDADLIAGFYFTQTNNFYSERDVILSLLSGIDGVVNNQNSIACAVIFFRECVTNVKKINFDYNGKAEILLKIYGFIGETEISGTNVGQKWHFDLPSNRPFSSAVLLIKNKEFEDVNYKPHASHNIKNIRFCCI